MTSPNSNSTLMRSSSWGDRIAITVSMLCAIHCLLLPVLLVALPTLSSSIIASEAVHLSLLGIAIPFSLVALNLGCKLHKRKSFIAIGMVGLGLMIFALIRESLGLGHDSEQIFTLLGAATVAFAHIRNFRLCRQFGDCSCENSARTPLNEAK